MDALAARPWAGICGELGADLPLMEQFFDMDIDELSIILIENPLSKGNCESIIEGLPLSWLQRALPIT